MADGTALLTGFRVVQVGSGPAAAVCGRMLADLGATVTTTHAAPPDGLLAAWLDHGKTCADGSAMTAAFAAADLVVCEGGPAALRRAGHDPDSLRAAAPTAAIVAISPFGQTGPMADAPATDLTLFCASGIARLLTGQVDDLEEAPIRPVGEQSAFIAGLAAACAGLNAALLRDGAFVDVSIQEALATLAMTELARAGSGGEGWSRRRLTDGNGATVTVLPAADGWVAVSPREDHQWTSWLTVMGDPAWGADPRFARKSDRIANFDALHALMSAWSRGHPKQWIADAAQAAHVPSLPLCEPAEQFDAPQLAHRRYWRSADLAGQRVRVPGPPFGLSFTAGDPAPAAAPSHLPLAGIRVLDFSWVIAGPTATRHLAAMGAEVVKVEAPGRGDPGRGSGLHGVLGQAKRGIVLDLKKPEAVAVARALAAQSDVLIENYATGVMDRLGLGAEAIRAVNPSLIYVSASGFGRTGPQARAVAYGTLLQGYTGFAGLNRHPDRAPRVGMAWLDPMCGLMLAGAVAAALWRRRRDGRIARIDFSMVEAMLWTMAGPLIAAQSGEPPQPRGNGSDRCAPHGVWRCAGDDAWLGLAVTDDTQWETLCAMVPGLRRQRRFDRAARIAAIAEIDAVLAGWFAPQQAEEAASVLVRAGIPAAPVVGQTDLVSDAHLRARGFWEDQPGGGVLPGLPWRAGFGRRNGPAPGLGADTDAVLRDVLGMDDPAIDALRRGGALG